MLNWRTLPYQPHKYEVVGTLLAAAYVQDCGKRFAIYERRTRSWSDEDKHYWPDVTYDVRDAETLSDDDVRMGKPPKAVFTSNDVDACERWVVAQMGEAEKL